MAQHYKNENITLSRLRTFLGWENFNPKGNVAPGRMDQNLCGRLWGEQNRSAVKLSVAESVPSKPLCTPGLLSNLKFRPASVGDKFGPTWSVHLFRLQIEIPASLNGEVVHLIWDSNSEGLVLSETGHPKQGLVGGDSMCRRADYELFPRPAVAGEKVTLFLEISCNGLFGAGRGGDIEPTDPDRFYELKECAIAAFNPDAWELISDLTVMLGMANDLPKESPRRAAALHAANSVVNAVQVSKPETYAAGLKIAASFLNGARNGDGQTTIFTQLHSHIDLAWLWPMSSTPRKGARTFASKLRLMEKYPEAVYVQSQAQLYEWVKTQFPTLYEEVKDMVAKGRFLPVGGTWVEMDCNVPCGESLVRQFVEGQSFFQKEFGIQCKEFWLPDTFGYPAQLPQIMRLCGIEYFLTQKLSWNLFNKFPHSTFVWEGLDGSDVITHFPPADTYNATGTPEEVLRSGQKNKDIGIVNASIMLVGHGDGGGGASPAMLESLQRMRDVDGIPKVKYARPLEFFEYAKRKKNDLPRWVMSELYFELHRGTFTSQANVKRDNFQCENDLLETEMLCTFARLQHWCGDNPGFDPFVYPESELRRLWRIVLLNQFHDTLPGSSIGEVYLEAAEGHAEVRAGCKTLRDLAMAHLRDTKSANSAPVANGSALTDQRMPDTDSTAALICAATGAESTDVQTPYIAEFSNDIVLACFDDALIQCPDPHQMNCANGADNGNAGGCGTLVALKTRIPGLGLSIADVVPLEEIGQDAATVVSSEDGFVLSNSLVHVKISRSGHVTSFLLLGKGEQQNRDAIANEGEGGNQFWIYDDVPMFWDAWDVEVYNFEKKWAMPAVTSCTVSESGPLRASVHFEYGSTDAGTKMEQTIALCAHSARLDFKTAVDWREARKLLRVEFPTSVRAAHASYGTQFGHVSRPTTFNTSWDVAKFEVCAHGYADLSEYGFGVALLTGGEKYGASARNHTLRLSLLKSARSPDDGADIGRHEFTYALLPHDTMFPCTEVLAEAADLARPPVVAAVPASVPPFGVQVRGMDSVVVSAVKFANGRDDAVVLRAFEALGGRGECRLELSVPAARVRAVQMCDLLEREIAPAADRDTVRLVQGSTMCEIVLKFAAFQIRSVIIALM